jgi:hypothetical protein
VQYIHHSEGLLACFILNVFLARALVASHENDQIKIPPILAMEDAD